MVVGPYPPTADPAGAVTLAQVRALRADGHDVLVISPEPSAARVNAAPHTRRGARRIAHLVRDAEIVVWVGAPPPDVVARALRAVPDVRRHDAPPLVIEPPGVAERVELLRAGAPTLLRSLRLRRRSGTARRGGRTENQISSCSCSICSTKSASASSGMP